MNNVPYCSIHLEESNISDASVSPTKIEVLQLQLATIDQNRSNALFVSTEKN